MDSNIQKEKKHESIKNLYEMDFKIETIKNPKLSPLNQIRTGCKLQKYKNLIVLAGELDYKFDSRNFDYSIFIFDIFTKLIVGKNLFTFWFSANSKSSNFRYITSIKSFEYKKEQYIICGGNLKTVEIFLFQKENKDNFSLKKIKEINFRFGKYIYSDNIFFMIGSANIFFFRGSK